MENTQKQQRIETYFEMWVKKDFSRIDSIFSADIYYSECYGPEYQGLDEIHLWIDERTQKQQVLEWPVKRYIHQENTVVVEWFFKDSVEGTVSGFDGVSIIEFGEDGKIASIKEFSSKAEHVFPYR